MSPQAALPLGAARARAIGAREPQNKHQKSSLIRRNLLVLRVTFRVFVGDYLRRFRRWVQIAKAAIAGEYITQMVARLECGVLAVPVHSARSDINYRAPGGIAKGMAWRSSKRRRRCKNSDTKREFRKAFQHNEGFLGFRIFLLK